jgi:hypothetical protein
MARTESPTGGLVGSLAGGATSSSGSTRTGSGTISGRSAGGGGSVRAGDAAQAASSTMPGPNRRLRWQTEGRRWRPPWGLQRCSCADGWCIVQTITSSLKQGLTNQIALMHAFLRVPVRPVDPYAAVTVLRRRGACPMLRCGRGTCYMEVDVRTFPGQVRAGK